MESKTIHFTEEEIATLQDAYDSLKKYQARYHGAPHAQKAWALGNKALLELRKLLDKYGTRQSA